MYCNYLGITSVHRQIPTQDMLVECGGPIIYTPFDPHVDTHTIAILWSQIFGFLLQ